MKQRCTFLALSVLLTSAVAHSERGGGPNVVGFGDLAEMLNRRIKHERSSAPGVGREYEKTKNLFRRQNVDGPCGPGKGSCAAGYCCSSGGYCGRGGDYCGAPDCQFEYGSGCDTLKVPSGSSTAGIARDRVGSVAYGGAGIYRCTVPGTIAITYDDGPFQYTSHVLDLLDKYNAKATFFITGNNLGKGEIDNPAYPWFNIIRRMINRGHQIASHTWGHQDLSKVSAAMRRDQMIYNEVAFNNILGYFPTYMRPPYSSCTAESGCQAEMRNLGYHVIYFDIDTEDYLYTGSGQTQTPKNDFRGNITRGPEDSQYLAIAHDIHYNTAYVLTEYMLQTIQQLGFRAVTVGECLNDPKANWYRNGPRPGSPTSTIVPTQPTIAPPSPPSTISTDGSCGGSRGQTCPESGFGNCCSQHGWCGSSSGHCGAGCQSSFGSCEATPGAPPPSRISVDGSCGGNGGFLCTGSEFGNCCSQNGWCGASSDYCAGGCQSQFGICT